MCDDDPETLTPVDVPSPERASQQALSYAEACAYQAERLSKLDDPDANVLAGELLALAARISKWKETPPTEKDRKETTDLFVALMRRAHATPPAKDTRCD